MTSVTVDQIRQPVFRAVGDSAVLVEFGSAIDHQIHDAVVQLDHSVQQTDIDGVIENIPAYTSLLICYDPIQTDYATVCAAVKICLTKQDNVPRSPKTWTVSACYSETFGLDLQEVSSLLNMPINKVIEAHLQAQYKVYMYGFAAGYAYLGGTPEAIQLPRKQSPVNKVAAGSVIIAGPQALVTTIEMPSGWWIIGRALTTPLQSSEEKPFLFDVGDKVLFEEVAEIEFNEKLSAQGVEG